MSDNLQERPAFCDTPGLSKKPGSLAATQCGGTDSMGQVKPDRPDIKSKALTDTDEKKKKLQKLGLTSSYRPSTETFQRFSNRIKGVDVDEGKKEMQFVNSLKTAQYSIKNTKTGQNYSTSRYQDDKKLDRIRKGGGDHKHAAHYKDGKVIDEYVGTEKKKESVKKHGYPNQNPKKDKYTGYVEGNMKTFAELTTGLLKRAAKQAGDEAETQRDAQAWALKVPGKGHAFGAAEASKKAAKKEKQAGKFSAAVDVRQRNTAFKKEDNSPGDDQESHRERTSRLEKQVSTLQQKVKKKLQQRLNNPARPEKEKVIGEKESDHADAIAAFKKKGGKVDKQKDGPISRSLFRTTVGREKRRNPGKQATRDTFYDEVEVSEGAELQAKMALDDAGIKYSTKNNSLTVKKRDLKKAQLAFEKSFKKGGWPKLKVEEVEVKELGPIGAFIAKKAITHVAKKVINKVTSKNEMMARSVGSQKKSRDKLFLARSRGETVKKAEQDNVNELSKELLDRAAQGANRKADQQRDVSAKAASRVGDTSQPPGQNIKSKRAGYQAAKKDYQAFKFGIAAKKKEKLGESNKLQADMALSDAGIKSYWEDGKLWVDKKDVMKAEKTLSKSFKKGGEPHIYYKGGFLGVWNKKRKITGG
jgi:hypothetical protein